MSNDPTITFADGQIILDAFRVVHGRGPRFHIVPPKLRIPAYECTQMLERIRHAKASITSQEPRLSPEVFKQIGSRPLGISFTQLELGAIAETLTAILAEAKPNPPHITALVANMDRLRELIAKINSLIK